MIRSVTDSLRDRETEEFSVLGMSLARKSCCYLLLLPDEKTLRKIRLWDLLGLQITLIVRRTVEHPQESTKQNSCWASEEPLGIQTGSVSELSTSVWISLRLEVTEMRIRQTLDLSITPRRSHRPMFGLLCRSTGNWVPDKPHWTMSRKDWAGAWRGVWRNFQGRSRQRELNESDTRSESETWELGSVIKV